MAKKAKKTAKKSGVKKPPKKAAKKKLTVKKVVKKQGSQRGAVKKTSQSPVKRSKPTAQVSETNKGLVSRAVEAIREVAAPLMPSKETDKTTDQ